MENLTIFILIYAVGVLINAFVAASIWDDLVEDRQLEKVRMTVLLFFVLASFVTWIYGCVYFLVTLFKSLFTRKKKTDGDEPQV
jgi:hypothetical protein